MDLTKVNEAVKSLYKELNTATDAEFKARNFKGLTRLDQASKALGLVENHLAKANPAPKPAKEKVKKA